MNSELDENEYHVEFNENRESKRKKSKKLNCKKCGQKNCPNNTYKKKLLCVKNQYAQKMYSDNRFYLKYMSKKNSQVIKK